MIVGSEALISSPECLPFTKKLARKEGLLARRSSCIRRSLHLRDGDGPKAPDMVEGDCPSGVFVVGL